jgi:hypothetical protein
MSHRVAPAASDPCSNLPDGVAEGVLDAAFLLEETARSAVLDLETLVEASLLVIAPSDHPLAEQASIAPADLEGEWMLPTESRTDRRPCCSRCCSSPVSGYSN